MRNRYLAGGLLAAALLSSTALAQTNAPAPRATAPAATATETTMQVKGWRASKMIGVNIYNEQNQKLGDINEVLLDPNAKVIGYVIGVGGFLGMGEHDILVEPSKIKFVNEPVRTTTSSNTTTTTTPTGAPANPNAAPSNTRNVSATARSANEQWYPDHGILSGFSKDQLKALPTFKY